MKKLFTLSLVAIFALSAFAKVNTGAQKAYRPQQKVEISTEKRTLKKSDAVAVKSDYMIKGNKVMRKPLSVFPFDANIGAAFERPANAFYCGVGSTGSSFTAPRMYALPFCNQLFVNQSIDTFSWAYQDPNSGDFLTSDEKDLSFDVKGYDFINAPALTQPGVVTDTAYTVAEYMQIGGEAYSYEDKTTGNTVFIGAANHSAEWDGFYYSTRYYGANIPTINSNFTQEYAELGIDTVKVVGYGELLNKPVSPYILTDVSTPMLAVQGGVLTLKIYKAVQDADGYWELGEQISESELEIEADPENISYAVFRDLVYIDPETGLDETLIIDDAVFVMVETDIQNHPLFLYHDEPLLNEQHAFEILNYTYNGEEVKALEDVNYAFGQTDTYYMSSFCFNYNIMMYYMHNNEDTDTFNAPIEGGEKLFSIDSYYSSAAWDVTTPEFEDLPDWITVELEDGTIEQDGQLYYNGVTTAKVTVAALPEGVESRTQDILLSYEGAQCTLHVVQPEGAGPEPQPVPGDVNGDGEVTGSDVTALYNHILFGQDTEIFNGDQNGDGEVTGSDVTAVYNIILGL